VGGWVRDTLLREFSVPHANHGEVLPVDYAGQFKESKDALIRGFEREYLTRLLSKSKGNIAKAARDAGLDRKHLYSLLHKYGLVQSDPDA
jgi:transcriptional regulator of acetoin/glycerol metabolism